MSAMVSEPPSENITVPSCGCSVVNGYDATCDQITGAHSTAIGEGGCINNLLLLHKVHLQ